MQMFVLKHCPYDFTINQIGGDRTGTLEDPPKKIGRQLQIKIIPFFTDYACENGHRNTRLIITNRFDFYNTLPLSVWLTLGRLSLVQGLRQSSCL
jgi:hypothetical protein